LTARHPCGAVLRSAEASSHCALAFAPDTER